MSADLNTNQSSKIFFCIGLFDIYIYFEYLVIEWVKQNIHEPATEQQTSLNSCTITMDDFRVYRLYFLDNYVCFIFIKKIGSFEECSTIK